MNHRGFVEKNWTLDTGKRGEAAAAQVRKSGRFGLTVFVVT